MVESFFKYIQFEKRFSKHTLVAYSNDLAQLQTFLTHHFPEHTIETASYAMLRSYIISLVESGMENSSINRKIACFRSFYKFLLRQEVITKNPMVKIRVLKTRKALPSFIKESDISSLFDHVTFEDTLEGHRDRLILELFYGTGMRLDELLKIQESRINVNNLSLKVLGKRNKERVIPFTSSLVPLIENYISTRNRTLGPLNHNYLFVTDKGAPCYPMMIYRRVKKYLQQYTSTDKASPHVLRHTYATHLLNHGAEINAVKDLLGHTSLAATQVYTHNSIEKIKKVYKNAHPKA